jgi:acyl carrier protein
VELAVARIFERVLDVIDARPEDSVSSLGGDSLDVVMIATELQAASGVDVSAQDVEDRTIAELSEWISLAVERSR